MSVAPQLTMPPAGFARPSPGGSMAGSSFRPGSVGQSMPVGPGSRLAPAAQQPAPGGYGSVYSGRSVPVGAPMSMQMVPNNVSMPARPMTTAIGGSYMRTQPAALAPAAPPQVGEMRQWPQGAPRHVQTKMEALVRQTPVLDSPEVSRIAAGTRVQLAGGWTAVRYSDDDGMEDVERVEIAAPFRGWVSLSTLDAPPLGPARAAPPGGSILRTSGSGRIAPSGGSRAVGIADDDDQYKSRRIALQQTSLAPHQSLVLPDQYKEWEQGKCDDPIWVRKQLRRLGRHDLAALPLLNESALQKNIFTEINRPDLAQMHYWDSGGDPDDRDIYTHVTKNVVLEVPLRSYADPLPGERLGTKLVRSFPYHDMSNGIDFYGYPTVRA